MTLNKAIEHGKEHRKQYTGGKAVDKRCCNHGNCPVCSGNRLYQRNKAEDAAERRRVEYDYEADLYDANPNCDHHIVAASGGGIKCTKCGGWFCY